MILDILKALFGGRNTVKEVAEVFTPNAEKEAQRSHEAASSALEQFGKEFQSTPRQHWFDRFIDGVNRVPRPLMAFGVIGLFASAMINPAWFSDRMIGIALIPDPLWWLLGAIVAFYFGGRHQAKVQSFSIQKQVESLGAVVAGRRAIAALEGQLSEPGAPIELNAANISEDEIRADLEQSSADRNPVIDGWVNEDRR